MTSMSNPDSARCLDIFQPIGERDFVRADGGIERREVVAAKKAADNQHRSIVHSLRMNFVHVIKRNAADIEASHYVPPHKTRLHHGPLQIVGNLNHGFVGIFRFRAAPLVRIETRAHPRARKTTDVIHISRPATAAITTTIIKSSQSKDIYSTSRSGGERRVTAFPAPGTVAVTVATVSARAA